MRANYLFTSESVAEGHPDKVCDRISDEIVDLIYREASKTGVDPWTVRIACETLATTKGIGFLAMDAREFLQTNVILLTMIIYAIIGVIADALVRSLEARFLSWHANYTKGEK